MRFHVLGPVRATNRGGQLSLGGRQQRLVLALLLSHHGHTLSTDKLVEDAWDGEPPSTARKTLQGYVHHLRQVVGDTIRSDGHGYRLDLGAAALDCREFEAAVHDAMEGNSAPAEVSERLADALALWTGTPYADVDHAHALRPEITRLSELRLSALEGRIQADIARGGGPDLIGELRSLTSEHPLRERFASQLMHALYLAGRQTEAIRTFDRAREQLIEQVGLDPSPELTGMLDRILQHDSVLDVAVDDGRPIHAIKGYELRETVAEDREGRTDRAYQTAIGRQVTIKVIEAPMANDTDFVAAFFDDASAVSRLAHPHLVPISDYWREPNRAYVVSPSFDGGSLAQRMLTAASFEQIASALAYAHRQGVAHGRISAEDIVCDLDGNAYVGGFTIGHPAGLSPDLAPGSGAADTRLTARVWSDIAGLTALLAEHGPENGRVEDLLRDFRRALGRDVTAMAGSRIDDRSELRNPFKGLRAFQEADEADFFGRTELTDAVVDVLDRFRFVTVVGASGSGKSSLVKAGVIPALKREAETDGSKLLVAEMYPGAYPFEELESALLAHGSSRPDRLLDILSADEDGFLRAVKTMLPADMTRFVLVVDQFEELFSMVRDEDRRSLFIRSLLAAANDDKSRISIVATLRADYFNRPLEYTELARAVEDGLVPVTPLGVDGLGRAVAGPARSVGLDLEPGLVSQIVADLEGQPGGLPLLQYALTEMFEARDSNVLTVETYRRIGGVAGALAGRAEALFNGLDATGQAAVRQCFLRLVSVDADKNDLRRRVRRSELTSLPVDQEALGHAIQLFGASRLLSFDRDPETRGPTIEIAHEALPREWERLRTWIEGQREDIVHHRAFVDAVNEWRSSGQDEGYLLRAGRLAQFESWADASSIRLTALESDFLEDSLDVRRAEEETEFRNRRRLKRLLTAASGFAIVAMVFGVVAWANSQRAEEQSHMARAEALAAQAASSLGSDPELSMLLAIEALERSPESRSASEALNSAYQANRTVIQIAEPELTGGAMSPDGSLIVVSTPEQLRLVAIASPNETTWAWQPPIDRIVVDTHFSSDGKAVVVGLALMDGPCAWDRWIVLDSSDGTPTADNVFPGLIPYYGGPAQNGPFVDIDQPMILGEGGADDCQSNPEEGRVVAADLVTGAQQDLVEGVVRNSRFGGIPSLSRNGDRLAVGIGDASAVLDVGSGDLQLSLPTGLTVLSEDGSHVLAGGNPLELWNVDDREKLREFKADFRVAWFSPSERTVYGATFDGRILVFDIETADVLFELRGHQGAIRTVQMSSDERFIGSVADDGVRVWDIGTPLFSTAGPAQFSAVVDEAGGVFQTTDIHVTGDYVVAKRGVCANADCDFLVEPPAGLVFDLTTVYDLETGTEVSSYPGGLIAVAPNERVVALQQTGPPVELSSGDTAGEAPSGDFIPYDGLVIADLVTGATIQELEGLCRWYTPEWGAIDAIDGAGCHGYPDAWRDYVHFAAFSRDGSLLAMAGRSGRYAVWDVETGEAVWTRDSESGDHLNLLALQTNVAFTPDGRHMLVAQRRTIEVLEVGSFEQVAEFETEGGAPTAIEFNPDGSLVVINDAHLNIHVVDTDTWERVHTLTGQQGNWFPDIAVDPAGRWVATAGLDNESRIWDLEQGEEVQRFAATPVSAGLRNVDWVDDNTLLLGSRRWAAMMTLDPEVLLANSRQRLTRSLTDQECATYGIDNCRSLEELRG